MAHLITYTPTFKKGFKLLSSLDQIRVTKAIQSLVEAPDPRLLGLRKHGQLSNVYAYEIGLRVRILYDFRDDELILIRVGSHDAVYH